MKLPQVKPREVIRTFEKGGWYVDHQKGSHVIMYHQDNRPVTLSIPMHTKDIPAGLLRSLIRDSGLSVEEFVKLLKS